MISSANWKAGALSILDRVKEQAAALDRQVSSADRAKLDEYLTSVREVEKRVERTRTEKDKADDRARDKNRPTLSMKRPDNGLPEDIREHVTDVRHHRGTAFQTDKTRRHSADVHESPGSFVHFTRCAPPIVNLARGNSDAYERDAALYQPWRILPSVWTR